MVERRPVKAMVPGSSPGRGAKLEIKIVNRNQYAIIILHGYVRKENYPHTRPSICPLF